MRSGSAADEVIDLSSDEDEESVPSTSAVAIATSSLRDIKPCELADVKPLLYPLQSPGCRALVPVKNEEPVPLAFEASEPPSPRALPPPRLCRQFWKSGEYVVARRNPDADAPGGRNRLRINPKFLHSNATSHKWAFGAIAELLDNAIDEVNNGATFVRVNKFTNPRDGSPSLLIQDDGGGMDPEALRCCMSFGFSEKQSDAFIGQYGNGFKTSTMRLGADVIVFTQSQKNWTPTRSIGLLSYTFLMETGCDDVLVPTVDYQYDLATASYTQLLRHNQKLFSSNLAILSKWSPFASEAELLKQFDDIGEHGTKVIVFNLWFNDDGDMELDFNSDDKDILITGAEKVKTSKKEKIAMQNYVANRLRYSLRAYASILYLRVPDNFRIILRGRDVEPHNVVNDLMYRECVLYKPQIAGLTELSIVTTIGFVKGAPDTDVQGFNVYHKNRLITPFWKVASNSYGKGRGVVGILDASFIKPTHDKQDFEKSVLYQRLENRLKEMTYEYWYRGLHCHRLGYDNKALPKASRAQYRAKQIDAGSSPASASHQLLAADIPTSSRTQNNVGLKRNFDALGAITETNNHQTKHRDVVQRKRFSEHKTLTLENDRLRDECLQYKESEKQLTVKEQKLRYQIAEERKKYEELLEELKSLDVKLEML
ncbi:unnamed protein product [Alopecurus aequalis]